MADLAAPTIEGIYETQMSPEFRIFLELGCICCVDRKVAKKLAMNSSTNTFQSFDLDQLQSYKTNDIQAEYLNPAHNILKRVFFYQHSMPSGKREIWSFFSNGSSKAYFVVFDTVINKQMPNLRNLYSTERAIKIAALDDDASKLPDENFVFEVMYDDTYEKLYRSAKTILNVYKEEKKGPMLLVVQSNTSLDKLHKLVPILSEFPQVQVIITFLQHLYEM